MKKFINNPIFFALLAAFFFGASAPLSKLLLNSIEPIPLAAFLYLGSGFGSMIYQQLRKQGSSTYSAEAGITRDDLPWLVGAVLVGGIAAPIILMISLNHTPATTASLLLNFEGVATTIIAIWVFKEPLGKRIAIALCIITLASILLSYNASGQWGFSLGSLGILAACTLWGLDNNFTRHISAKDPQKIVMIKGLAAGSFSLLLAILLNNHQPSWSVILLAVFIGYICYGLSITLFILALRHLGATRTSIIFSTAPFIGFLLSIIIISEAINPYFLIATPLMIVGTWLMLTEHHEHIHNHLSINHEHNHNHTDGHHAHPHSEPKVESIHSHTHQHPEITHAHPHTPDIHHRHNHI